MLQCIQGWTCFGIRGSLVGVHKLRGDFQREGDTIEESSDLVLPKSTVVIHGPTGYSTTFGS